MSFPRMTSYYQEVFSDIFNKIFNSFIFFNKKRKKLYVFCWTKQIRFFLFISFLVYIRCQNILFSNFYPKYKNPKRSYIFYKNLKIRKRFHLFGKGFSYFCFLNIKSQKIHSLLLKYQNDFGIISFSFQNLKSLVLVEASGFIPFL